MPAPAKKSAITPIPVQLSETEFTKFILPHLSMPRRGPKCKLGYPCLFNLILWVLYTGMPWKGLPVPKAPDGTHAIHYTTVYKVFARWSDDGSLEHAFVASGAYLCNKNQLDLSLLHGDSTNTVAKKGGDGMGHSSHKHQKGDKVIAIVDNNGYIRAPLPIAPVNEADTVLLPEGLKALKRIGKQSGLSFKGAYLNLDGGFDSASNRKAIFNAGLIPNVKENPRNRKRPKRAANGCSTKPFMTYGTEWSGRLPGKTNLSGCCCGLSTCNVGTTP
jgi:transposase